MKLILARHGETIENEQGIIQGHLPGTLSKKGIEQIKRVAERLRDESIDFIYSSDLARSADTAKEIAKYHPNTPIKFVRELRERNMGEFQGKKKSDIEWYKKRKHYSELGIKPKGGESLEELHGRAKRFLYDALRKHKNDTVLFVGHNGINKALMCAIANKPASEIPNMGNFGETSITIIEIDEDKKHKLRLFNCTKHLA